MDKEFFRKNKKVFFISIGLVFVVSIFFLKSSSNFKNTDSARQEAGLIYNKQTVRDLVNRDTDGDGVPDWQEILWGTDPTKTETVDGVPDSVEIQKLKASGETEATSTITGTSSTADSTTTNEFSKELFSTVASLTETGGVDQNTVDTLSSSLAQQINNPVVKKVFTSSEIKISSDNSAQAIKIYGSALANLFNKYPTLYTGGVVTPIAQALGDAMQTYLVNGNDVHALSKLNSTIKTIDAVIVAMTKMTVPQNLSTTHLAVLNGFEIINENLNDIQLTDTDPVVTVGAGNNFPNNIANLQGAIDKLRTMINQGLSN
jgi:hypothetical protein